MISNLIASCLFLLGTVAGSDVVQLTAVNFDELTAKKSVFIKFFAPWCGHCQAMKEDWEKLASDWKDSATGLIGEVDCTVEESEKLCEDFEVAAYPTIMYGDAKAADAYEGAREYEEMAAFAKENLSKVPCNMDDLDSCPADVQATIKDLKSKSVDDLKKSLEAVETELQEAENAYEAEMDALNDRFDEIEAAHQDKVKAIRTDGNQKYIKMVLASLGASTESDEKKDEL